MLLPLKFLLLFLIIETNLLSNAIHKTIEDLAICQQSGANTELDFGRGAFHFFYCLFMEELVIQ